MNPRRRLVEGWHELAIDCAKQLLGDNFVLFVIEGRVLRSTAPSFAGENFHFVCSLRNEYSEQVMVRIAECAESEPLWEVVETASWRRVNLERGYLNGSDTAAQLVDGSVKILAALERKRLRTGGEVLSASFLPLSGEVQPRGLGGDFLSVRFPSPPSGNFLTPDEMARLARADRFVEPEPELRNTYARDLDFDDDKN